MYRTKKLRTRPFTSACDIGIVLDKHCSMDDPASFCKLTVINSPEYHLLLANERLDHKRYDIKIAQQKRIAANCSKEEAAHSKQISIFVCGKTCSNTRFVRTVPDTELPKH